MDEVLLMLVYNKLQIINLVVDQVINCNQHSDHFNNHVCVIILINKVYLIHTYQLNLFNFNKCFFTCSFIHQPFRVR